MRILKNYIVGISFSIKLNTSSAIRQRIARMLLKIL